MVSRTTKFFLFFLLTICNGFAIENKISDIEKNEFYSEISAKNLYNISDELIDDNIVISEEGLNLINILEIALKNNPKVRESWTNIDISKYSYREELSNLFPTINGELRYSRNKTKYDDETVQTDRNKTLTPSVTLSYLLFDFGGREADILNFKYKLNSVNYETNDYIQLFIYDVINVYYSLFSAIANERAAKEAENASYEAYKAADLRYKIGLVPLTDKLQAETSYMREKLNREKLENNTKIEMAQLNYLLNLSPTEKLKLSIPYLQVEENKFQEDIDSLIKTAMENRQDLKKYYETKKSKKAEIYSARVNRLPSVSLTGSYGHINDLENDGNNDRNSYNIGITATMPFFTGGYIHNNIAKTKSELKAIDYRIASLQKNIELDVWTAYQNFLTAEKTHKTSVTLLESATETAKNILGKYKNGKSSILDLLNAQTDLANARYDFIESHYNWFINRANLLRAIGKININELNNLDK